MRLALLIFIQLTFLTVATGQTIRYVSATGTSANAGAATSWATSTTDLQGAINASAPGDQVWVSAGTYKPTNTTGPDSRTISFSLKDSVAIYGGFRGTETMLNQRPGVNPNTGQPSSTTLSGDIGTVNDISDNSYHVIRNPAKLVSSSILDGFVITKGNANGASLSPLGRPGDDSGGGISNAPVHGAYELVRCSPTIRNCLLVDNKAIRGGGMVTAAFHSELYISEPVVSPALVNCRFSQNTAESGGAIFSSNESYRSSNPTVTNCVFESNSAVTGGVVTNVSSGSYIAQTTFYNSVFRRNSATNGGVAVCIAGKSSSFTQFYNSVFEENEAQNGGVLYVNNNVFSDAIANFFNCSFRSNTATRSGGAFYLWSYWAGNDWVAYVRNSIFWNNGGSNTFVTGGTGGKARVVAQASLSEPSAILTNYVDKGNNQTTTTSPFVSATSLQLSPCSSAIDAGSNSAISSLSLTTDLAGNPRYYNGGTVDMGAYEFQGDKPTPVSISRQPVQQLAICQGSTTQLSIGADGSVTGYQWYRNGAILSGQTSSTLTLADATSAAAGTYTVGVLGQCNSVTSVSSSVTVNATPTNLKLSSGTLTCAQTSLTLTASADMASQLKLSNGEQNNTGLFTVNQPGTYTLTASNSSGCTSATTVSIASNTTAPSSPQLSSVGRLFYTSPTPLTLTQFITPTDGNSLRFSGVNGSLVTPVVSISAAGDQVYSVTQQGANGCVSAPTFFTLTISTLLATEPFSPTLTISVAPNPVITGKLQGLVRGAGGSQLTVQLINMPGESVQTQHWLQADTEQRLDWNVSQYPAGVYLLRAQVNDRIHTIRIIKE